MKRWIVVACALALLASGAGGQAASGASTLKIGMVTDVGGLNDRGFNHLAYVGMLQAQKRLGVSIRVAESRSPADYIPNLAAFARQGYDLVLGVGFADGDGHPQGHRPVQAVGGSEHRTEMHQGRFRRRHRQQVDDRRGR